MELKLHRLPLSDSMLLAQTHATLCRRASHSAAKSAQKKKSLRLSARASKCERFFHRCIDAVMRSF